MQILSCHPLKLLNLVLVADARWKGRQYDMGESCLVLYGGQ